MPNYDLGTAEGKIVIDSSGVGAGVNDANAQLGQLGKGAGNSAAALQTVGAGLLGVGGAALAGFGLALKTAADFEKQMSAIDAVSDATEGQMEEVRKAALRLGADTSFSASEAALAMEELIKAGLTTEEVLNGAADATVALAAAGAVDLVTAATLSANAMNAFGLAAEDLPHVADLIAGAANASAIDVGQFGQSLQQSAAVANLAGVSFDDLAVAIAAMGNAGIVGSDAGTSIKTFLNNLQPTTAKQIGLASQLGLLGSETNPLLEKFTFALGAASTAHTEAVKEFGAGSDEAARALANQQTYQELVNAATTDGQNLFYDTAGNLRDLGQVSNILGLAVGDLTAQERQLALETLFGSDAIRAAAVIADQAGEGFYELADAVGAVSAEEVAAERLDNLSGAIEQLKGSVETYLIGAGTPFLDSVKELVQNLVKLVNFFGNLPAPLQKFISMAILLGGALLVTAGAGAFFLGTFIKFATALKQFKAIFSIAKGVGALTKSFGALNAVLLINPIFLIIAALIALGVALFVLYKKNEAFRKFVDKLWQTLQKVWDQILDFFKGLPAKFTAFFKAIGDAFTGFFSALPGIAVEGLKKVADAIVGFLTDLPEKMAYWLGFAIGKWINFHVELYALVIKIFADVLQAILDFLIALPGNFVHYLGLVLTFIKEWGTTLVVEGFKIGRDFVASLISFIMGLPGQVFGFLTSIITGLPGFAVSFFSNALSIGQQFVKGLVSGVGDLVGLLKGMITNALNAVKETASSAYNTAKDIGSSIWNGFKKGLFGSPSTKVEYAVWDMVANVGKSLNTLKDQVRGINMTGAELANVTPDGVSGSTFGATGLRATTPTSAPDRESAGGLTVQGPLIGEAKVDHKYDAMELARDSYRTIENLSRAQGKRSA